MCEKHEKEIVKETDVIERGQSSPSQNHEKGARDQKFPNFSQVGQPTNDRTHECPASEGTAPDRSLWFDDPTKEIGAASGSTGIVRGWVYVRTQTGHLKKRTGR